MAIQKIFVVGAGLMGSGIAQNAITAGYAVTLNDQNMAALERAKGNIEKMMRRDVEKGRMPAEECEAALARLTLDDTIEGAKDADLVIEAIYENLQAKQAVFQKLEDVCPEHTIFASNTSSISLTALAAATKRPEQVLGMHFFNPAPAMKLVEVIRGARTNDETFKAVYDCAAEIGKSPVEVGEAPGFVVNRILFPMINEAIIVLENGIASKEDIDTAMMYGANHKMGPLALADLVGLDICLAIMETIFTETGDSKYRPALTMKKMVRAGLLGQKTGEGFYKY